MTVKVKDNDKIVFENQSQENQEQLKEVLSHARGAWKEHPVFSAMSAKQIVEYLRGKDCDV